MIFDNSKIRVPFYSGVIVNNKHVDADVYIILPNDEDFEYNNCVAIFFFLKSINNVSERVYCKVEYFDKINNSILSKTNLGKYDPTGVYLFFKDLNFLNDFLKTNPKIIHPVG